ncbi:MAG: alpha/beta hydrolase [Anaerolineae bacterium]|nr:alpha/beta hydrolase [Anaerolineae bacterium]
MSTRTNLLSIVRTVLLAVVGGVGAWIAYSRWGVDHGLPLPPAIEADRKTFTGRHRRCMSYYSDTRAAGRPLVLVHSINAAASAYEMRPLFEHYRASRPVYALELPGFGFAERSNQTYSYELYADSIADFMAEEVGQPADVIALSLSSEFAARAALEQPDWFHSLTLISPSGFTARSQKVSSQRASENGASDKAYRVLSNPLWSQAIYDLLGTRASIHYFLSLSFVGPVDDGLADYDYATTHQPGARFAPLYFVSGKLFSPDILETVYQKLELPVLVVYDRDGFVRFDELPALAEGRSNWKLARIAPTKGLPQFEKMPEVAAALDQFWGEG